MKNYDVIIIGAGSIGLACAWALSEKKLDVLVIEEKHSFGQGQNKAAIGGIRATHSQPAKIAICNQSIKVFSTWKEKYGDNIDWVKGGYLYPAYNDTVESTLKNLLQIQHENNLNINWLKSDEILKIVPTLKKEGLKGGTFSPDDGHLSPLLSAQAFYKQSKKANVEFHFNEHVINIEDGKVFTNRGFYDTDSVIISTGMSKIKDILNIDIPVTHERHEAAITEPTGKMFDAMVVDINISDESSSFYFYQNKEGQIIFCLSPNPPSIDENANCTSSFLINASRRLLKLMPSLPSLKIRRTWCGFYPMTPDGVPFLDKLEDKKIYIAVGMCGQGLMLSPGMALNIAEKITNGRYILDEEIMESFSLCRVFSSSEILK